MSLKCGFAIEVINLVRACIIWQYTLHRSFDSMTEKTKLND